MSKVLLICAHPQDEVLGSGGTLAKHAKAGDDVFVSIMSQGARETMSEEEKEMLRKETLDAAEILGLKEVFQHNFKYMCFNATPMIEFTKALTEDIKEVVPDIVYTHHRGDVNTDHQMVWNAAMAATRSFGENKASKICCFEDPSTTTWAPPFLEYAFLPNVFEDITDTIDIKIGALEAYKSERREFPHPRSAESLRLTAQVWGIRISAGPTEAFELIREL